MQQKKKDYYNKLRKEEYIKYLEESKTNYYIDSYKTLFRQISDYEEELEKDISDFTIEELSNTLNRIAKRRSCFQTAQSKMKKYIEKYKGKEESEKVKQVTFDRGLSLKNGVDTESITTRKILYNEILPLLKNNQDKLFFIFFFENICHNVDELVRIKYTNINLNLRTIHITRKNQLVQYKLTDEVCSIITKAIGEEVHNIYSLKANKRKGKYENSEYLLKSISNADKSAKDIYKSKKERYIARKNEICNYLIENSNSDKGKLYANMLQPTQLRMSGMLEQLFQMDKVEIEDINRVYINSTGGKKYAYTNLKAMYEALSGNQVFRTQIEKNGRSDFDSEYKWTSEKNERGLKAEKLVFDYFKKKYSSNHVYKVEAYNGYDIKIGSANVEIKNVSSSPKLKFFISINELTQAKLIADHYYLALVINDEDINQTIFIKNPIKALSVNLEEIEEKLEHMNSTLQIENISVVPIKCDCINLNEFIGQLTFEDYRLRKE